MKTLLSFLCLGIFCIQTVSAEFILSSSDEEKVDQAIVLINDFIDKNGEDIRSVLLIKINQILARPNLSEKNTAIFTKLSEGLKKPANNFTFSLTGSDNEEIIIDNTSEDTQPGAAEPEEKIEIQNNVDFIFENTANRCAENPCDSYEDFVKIKGSVSTDLVTFVEVNNYRLTSYNGSTWEYNANIAYDNYKNGKNIYSIRYLGAEGNVLYTEEFVINKLLREVIEDNTTENIANKESEQIDTSNIPVPIVAETEAKTLSAPSYSIDSDIPYVDEDEVREYWRGLLNEERTLLGLTDYIYDKSLDATAKAWSDLAVDRGYIDHKVDSPSDSYYDYWKKAAWMEDNGVVCENISRATFSESIAYNNYYCNDTSKCTDEIKKAVKRTYDFYMSEKGTDYDPHYRAIAHPLFETMGLGLSVVELGDGGYRMYLTNHYCTRNTK